MKYALVFPFLFLLLLWLVKILEEAHGWNLYEWGVYPLERRGIAGIFTQIFIHSDYSHLLANTLPLLILGWLIFYFYGSIAPQVSLSLWLCTGVLTWLMGRPGWHIGASGLIYGLAFFLFFSGIIRHNTRLMAVSFIVAFLYGSIVWNMLPIAELYKVSTSWEGHLAGALSGTFLAFLYRRHGPQRDVIEDEDFPDDEEEDENESYDSGAEESGAPGDAYSGKDGTAEKKGFSGSTSGCTSPEISRKRFEQGSEVRSK